MSTLSDLESQLTSLESELNDLLVTQGLINEAKAKYSEVLEKDTTAFTAAYAVVNEISVVNNYVGTNGGDKVETITNKIKSIAGLDNFFSLLETLREDVSKTYNDLCTKESEVNTSITQTQSAIDGVKDEIRAERVKEYTN